MKQLLLFIFLLISATPAFAQSAIAELKFEEAETAYNKGDYELTLKKVQEYEKAKGNTTAKALYLRIVAQARLFSPDDFYTDESQLTLYTSLNENAAKYLKAMENEGLDDKYREVYTISEKLKELNLPKDKEGWQKGAIALEAQRRAEADHLSMKLRKNQNYVLQLAASYFFVPKMTLSQLAVSNAIFAKVPASKARKYVDTRGRTVFSRGNPYGGGAGEIIADQADNVVCMTIFPNKKRKGQQRDELREFIDMVKQNIDKEYITVIDDSNAYDGTLYNISVNVPGSNLLFRTYFNGSSFEIKFEAVP